MSYGISLYIDLVTDSNSKYYNSYKIYLRYIDTAETQYKTIGYVDERTADDLIDAGVARWHAGKKKLPITNSEKIKVLEESIKKLEEENKKLQTLVGGMLQSQHQLEEKLIRNGADIEWWIAN